MTRKDYVLLADTIKNARKVENAMGGMYVSVAHLANTLATELEIDNPRFDRHRILIACGVHDSTMADVLATAGKVAK
jgi:hypothetical protein